MKIHNSKNKMRIDIKLNYKHLVKEVEPRLLLSDFIRYDCNLTGTHVGCEHGICGACTILYNKKPIRSCLMLAPQINNSEIITVEGLANDNNYQDVKESLKKYHALQCGYCTPGFFITIISILSEKTVLNKAQIKEKLSGNICRCTGYAGIVDAVSEVVKTRYSKNK